MKKKFILSVAATAALLMASPGVNEADAAEHYEKVNSKVYFYQTGNLNQEYLNQFLQKYFNGVNWTSNYNQSNQSPQKQTTPVEQEVVQQQTEPVQEQPTNTSETEVVDSQVSAFEQQVVDLTNQQRAEYGLPAVQLDSELSKVAKAKSQDMNTKKYFSHTSPTYGSPFDMMKQYGISYRAAGENIAMGQRTPEEVVNAWMNSEGHRKNILNSSYTHIGVGYVSDGNYWTQMFIGK